MTTAKSLPTTAEAMDKIGEKISEKPKPSNSEDGRHKNPGRPKGLPRDASYAKK